MAKVVYALLCLAVALSAISAGTSGIAEGQTTLTARCAVTVKLGDYDRLTIPRKLKIGAALFVNPGLFRTTAVAYEYNLQTLAANVGSAKLLAYIVSGKGALATISGEQTKVLPSDAVTWAEILSQLKRVDSPTLNLPSNVAFVATVPEIDGVPSTRPLVSWAASKSVIPNGGAGCPSK